MAQIAPKQGAMKPTGDFQAFTDFAGSSGSRYHKKLF
jgi:hypothetical protein